jgi:hypothetical protein
METKRRVDKIPHGPRRANPRRCERQVVRDAAREFKASVRWLAWSTRPESTIADPTAPPGRGQSHGQGGVDRKARP